MKKLLYILIGLGLSIAGIAHAINVTVPQSPAAGAVLFGNANGTYNSSTTPLLIDKTNGRVIIGTSTSSFIFDSYGTAGTAGQFGNSISSTAVTGWNRQLQLYNVDPTTNNGVQMGFVDSVSGASSAALGAVFTDRTNHYGDILFTTRSAAGFTEKLRVLSTGNVGIGVVNPQSLLHVKKDGGSTTAFSGDQVRIDSGVSGDDTTIHFTDGVTSDAGISFTAAALNTSRSLNFSLDDSTKHFIIRGDGNVGVGATTPDAKFYVDATHGAGFRVDYNATGDNYLDGGNFYLRNLNGSSNVLTMAGTSQRIGIGTTTPAAKLHIQGGNTNDLIVDNDGSQYTEIDIANKGTVKASQYWDNTNTNYVFSLGSSAYNYNFLTGNVGINTSTPLARLTIAGTGGASTDLLSVASSSALTGLKVLANGAYYSMAISSTTISTIAYTVDLSQSNVQSFVLSTSTTLTITNIKAGLRGILNLQQDTTGSRTITWPSSFHWPASTAPTLTTTASKVDVVSYECYSVNVCFAGSNLNYAP